MIDTPTQAVDQMKFSELPYQRPDMEELEKEFKSALQTFTGADDFETQSAALAKLTELRNHFGTMEALASIRHTVDTRDEFYEEERNFFDKNSPLYMAWTTDLYKALIGSKFRAELEEKWGAQLFTIAEMTLRTFKPEVMEDMQQENALASEYTKVMSSATIEFEGEELNLSGFRPYEESPDRELRKRAGAAKYKLISQNEDKFDRIYDDLVKVRTRIAKTLGYDNYVALGYDRMLRSDYNAQDVVFYREQILKYVVPLATKLREQQAKRLGLDSLKYYDEALLFTDGNAQPQGDPEWIINHGKTMYNELSAETDEFFNFMIDRELMDLVNKKGKAPGGYCNFISDYKAPYIFSNFNGTSGDIDVLTHEAGHAFQCYMSRNYEIPEYNWPTYEACEIHSMSMEFFAWPWMDLFFEDLTDKYKYGHLAGSLLFLPYGAAIDEFQHYVYENPNVSPDQRKQAWRTIESKYLPHRDYDGNEYLERGGFWQKQSHLFHTPFYYIDYTLAQVCALQFWKRANEDRDEAWSDYVDLCKAGGSKAFLELVELAGLKSPFTEGVVPAVVAEAEAWLDAVDHTKL